MVDDKKDGNGENYLAIDVNSILEKPMPISNTATNANEREPLKVAPSLIVRINQSMLESKALMDVKDKEMSSKVENFEVNIKDDGIHVSGDFHALFLKIPFETTVDLVTTGADVFEVRVRELQVAGLDLEFLTNFILEAMKVRLDKVLNKICAFKYIGEEKDHSRALQVTVEPKNLIPAFPDLHLVKIDVRERELLLKIGHP